MISTNRRMRTRMSGGVGAGGEKPPATRLALYSLCLNPSCVALNPSDS